MSLAPLVLTRPAAQALGWARQLEAAGVPVRLRPLIDIEPDAQGAAAARQALNGADGVFFSSPAAVQALGALAWPALLPAACVGPGTAAALRAIGVLQVLSPPPQADQFDSEALWPVLEAAGPWQGKRWVWLRGDGGREWLMDRLRQAGAEVRPITVYHRRAPEVDPLTLAVELAQPALWLFSSSEALEHLSRMVPTAAWDRVSALATHPRIAQRAIALGMSVQEVRPEVAAVVAAWRQWVAP